MIRSLNHSCKFLQELRHYYADAIEEQDKEFIGKPQPVTGTKTPIGIVSGKMATRNMYYIHFTLEMISLMNKCDSSQQA